MSTTASSSSATILSRREHPLESRWTLQADGGGRPPRGTEWIDTLTNVYTFGTIENFWRLWNNLTLSSRLHKGSNYHLFQDGIQPMWEDKANKKGGKWTLHIPRHHQSDGDGEMVDGSWLHTVLAMIGGTIGDGVTGAVVSLRNNGDRVALWTGSCDKESTIAIGEKFREILKLPGSIKLRFERHQPDTTQRRGRRPAPLYTL